jgi:prolyl oligopeptidase
MDGTVERGLPVPPHHTADIRGADDGYAFLTLTSYATPPTVYRLELETLQAEVVHEREVPFDTTGVTVKQVWYTSRDGTRAPMYVMYRTDTPPDGERPTLLTGYGGFNVSLKPRFDAMGAAWVERGGVFAVATLRGGGEFGEEWHRDGMLENKQNVFDDFIGAAEFLIDNDYTNSDHLAIRGGSNGGLLVASAMTQRPDLYRAVLCTFPDLDMVRFYTFGETNNKPALLEYGDASDPEQFAFLRQYSPYQAVREGVDYPAVMLTTGDLDTRVSPLQARKMAARLQSTTGSGLPVILHYDEKAGHAGGRPFSKRVSDTAMAMTFLLTQLGAAE